jgi:hypothetical protein
MAADKDIYQWSPRERARMKVLYWVLVAVCIVTSGVGWYLIQWQRIPVEHSVPVQATVRSVSVLTQDDGKGHVTKHPLVLYSYEVGGVAYTTDRIVPATDRKDGAAAAALIGRLHEGDLITAYYDSMQPSSAYLVREHTWLLYLYSIGPLVLALFLIFNWPRVARTEVSRI